jgi:hypothetical protein
MRNIRVDTGNHTVSAVCFAENTRSHMRKSITCYVRVAPLHTLTPICPYERIYMKPPNVREATQRDDGSYICTRCRGDWYACDCPRIHMQDPDERDE